MVKTIFNNSSEAYKAGYRPVDTDTDRLVEHRYFTKVFENPAGQRSILVRLNHQPTSSGSVCQFVPMYPPRVE